MSKNIVSGTRIVLVLTILGCVVPCFINALPVRYWFYHGALLHIIGLGGFLCIIPATFIGISVIFSKKANSVDKSMCALLCALLFLFAIFLFPLPGPGNERLWRYSCASNLKQIFSALQYYAADFAGNYPSPDGAAGLEMLRKSGYLTDCSIYACPSTITARGKNGQPLSETTVDYIYIGGLNTKSDPNLPIVYDKEQNHGNNFGNVLFAGGTVSGFGGSPWTQNIKK